MSFHGEAPHTQQTYRKLLMAMSLPGLVHEFSVGFDHSTPCLTIAETLLDHEVSFSVIGDDRTGSLETQISALTKAVSKNSNEADYCFVVGPTSHDHISKSKRGIPEYPELGATYIYLLDSVDQPLLGDVTLMGPGIKNQITPQMPGLDKLELSRISSVNREFPLGVDCVFVNTDKLIMCIPRSTKILVS